MRISGANVLGIVFIASLHECNSKQSGNTEKRIDALLIFQDDTITYVMLTKLTVCTCFLTDEPIKLRKQAALMLYRHAY